VKGRKTEKWGDSYRYLIGGLLGKAWRSKKGKGGCEGVVSDEFLKRANSWAPDANPTAEGKEEGRSTGDYERKHLSEGEVAIGSKAFTSGT